MMQKIDVYRKWKLLDCIIDIVKLIINKSFSDFKVNFRYREYAQLSSIFVEEQKTLVIKIWN